ncbi:MAG: hypothetical protein HC881_06785 [Leptolyngbyaceae cyanobacterium SL_7_1]|nr:hypothetical protein [Leptolyngbyaceae cyanobacterium SL_7_1]
MPARPGYVRSSLLLLVAFASVFFPRLLETIGFPAAINFVHFAVVPVAAGLALLQTRTRDRQQRITTQRMLLALWLLLTIEFASALWNGAGAINAILSFLLLTEPFLLLVALCSLPLSKTSVEHLRGWFIRFNLFHLFLALVQRFVFRVDLKPGALTGPDAVQGVFYLSGSGHVVGASVAFTFGVYYFLTAKKRPLWLRGLILFLSFIHLNVADAKQALLSFALAFAALSLIRLKDIKKAVIYITFGTVAVFAFIWAIQNIPFLDAFNTWIRPGLYGPDGEGTRVKLMGVYNILDHYTSPVNAFIGLGPGHTIDRLGGWMLKDYESLLAPFGATRSTVADETWAEMLANWLGASSTFFSPFFGWAGIWGDLGLLGLGAYLWLWVIVWQQLCADDLCRFVLLTAAVFGFFLTQLQEPGYMLSVTFLIGMRSQEIRQTQLENYARKIEQLRNN